MAVPALQVNPPSLLDIGRNAITAANEAQLLRDVLIREVRALGVLYCVGRRKPITELSPEKQAQVREAYKDTHWASDYCVDLVGICTSKQLAERLCKERGPAYFLTKLPIDSLLTEDTVFGEWEHQFPASDATDLYENLAAKTVALPVSHLRALKDEIERLQQQVNDLVGYK